MSRFGAKSTVICATGYRGARAQLLKPAGIIQFPSIRGLFYGLKSNGLVASIWLKIVLPVEDGVACVTINAFREANMDFELTPT